MELSVTTENDTLIIESDEKEHTLMNLLRKSLWENGVEAGYDRGHPYAGGSRLIVKDGSKKALKKAIKKAENDVKEFQSAFDKAF